MTVDQVPPTPPLLKPLLRGRLHQLAVFAAIPAGVALFVHAGGLVAQVAVAVYMLTMIAMFGVSALYHVHHWEPGPRRMMRRLDHSMIFVFIAGSYTPFCLLVLHGPIGISVLIAAWTGAVVGVTSQLHPRFATGRTHYLLYIGLGWLVTVGTPQLVRGLTRPELVLLVVGGLLYTSGALVLAKHRPNPVPGVFGFHEVWHTMVVLACICHYLLIWQLVP